MDILPHSTDIFEGPTHEEAIERVKIRMEVEDSVEDIIRGVQDILYLELCAEGPDMDDFNLRLGAVTGTCSHCLADYYMVEQRCADIYENPPDYLSISWGEEILCQSCNYDGKKCECCGISEKLVKMHCDRNVKFVEIEGAFPPQYLCDECKDYEQDHPGLISEMNEVLETYSGEFEIDTEGDTSLLQDEGEETKATKDMMKEIMDEMFGISEEINENTYMTIVNKMKQVYERL
jgi:hypothetical protein